MRTASWIKSVGRGRCLGTLARHGMGLIQLTSLSKPPGIQGPHRLTARQAARDHNRCESTLRAAAGRWPLAAGWLRGLLHVTATGRAMWTSAWRTSKCVDVALENAPMSAVSEFLRPVSPPRNSKSGHQLIQNSQGGILSLSPG